MRSQGDFWYLCVCWECRRRMSCLQIPRNLRFEAWMNAIVATNFSKSYSSEFADFIRAKRGWHLRLVGGLRIIWPHKRLAYLFSPKNKYVADKLALNLGNVNKRACCHSFRLGAYYPLRFAHLCRKCNTADFNEHLWLYLHPTPTAIERNARCRFCNMRLKNIWRGLWIFQLHR